MKTTRKKSALARARDVHHALGCKGVVLHAGAFNILFRAFLLHARAEHAVHARNNVCRPKSLSRKK